MQKGLSSSPFLAINAKGGESIKPKGKGPHNHFKKFHKCLFQLVFELDNWCLKVNFSIGIPLVQRNFNWFFGIHFKKGKSFQKPS
jgi:hypothetical protein